MRNRVYQRGAYWAVDWTDSRTGKRRRLKVGRTKAEAQVALAKLQTEAFAGRWRDGKGPIRVLFEDFALNEYLPWAKANLKSWDRTEHFVRRAIETFKGFTLDEVTPALVEKFKTVLASEKVSGTDRVLAPRTANYALVTLKAVFTKAVVWQKATSNPVRPVKLFTCNNVRLRYLDQKEVEALLSASEGGPAYLKPLVTVLCNTGLRIGEALALKWTDVDFPKDLLSVRHGKGDKARTLPLNEPTKDALRSLVTVNGVVKDQGGFVFTYRGHPVIDVRGAFRAACSRAGLGRDVTPHTLRKTFASHLASNGVDLIVLRDLLGHSSVNVTLARYGFLFPDRGKKAVDLLPGLWKTQREAGRAQGGHKGTEGQGDSASEVRRDRTEESSRR